MTPAHEQLYWQTLRSLATAGFEFCVIGTFALRCQVPALAAWPVADCDLLLPNQPAAINALATHLRAHGWAVTLWEQPVQLPLSAAALAGKYYLRARQAGAVLDCTYECDHLSWLEFAARRHWHCGVPLAASEHSLLLKARRNSPADRQVIELCRL